MDIVIDTSAIIAVIVGEPQRNKIVELTTGKALIGPSSIPWEIGNAFSAMIKRERITLEQAQTAIEIYKQIPIRFTEVELEDTLEIVSKYGIYAYDAYLIRCAIKYKSALITLDRKLAQVAEEMNLPVVEVVK